MPDKNYGRCRGSNKRCIRCWVNKMNHGNKRKKKATKTIEGTNRRWGIPHGEKQFPSNDFNRNYIKGLSRKEQKMEMWGYKIEKPKYKVLSKEKVREIMELLHRTKTTPVIL